MTPTAADLTARLGPVDPRSAEIRAHQHALTAGFRLNNVRVQHHAKSPQRQRSVTTEPAPLPATYP